jgi:hypothetical protein
MSAKKAIKGARRSEPGETGWKRRPSEIRGYQMAHFMNTEAGDYLRVDYNLKEKRIRLFIEDADEGGNPYFAVVSNGKVISQRNVTSGREADVISRLQKRAVLFNSLPPRDVRNIVKTALASEQKESARGDAPAKNDPHQELLDRTRRRYFKEEEGAVEHSGEPGARQRSAWGARELIDVLVGLAVCAGIYFYNRDFVIIGIAAGVIGMGIGAIDIIIRRREPSIIKTLLFMLGGLSSYIYGYYYF